MPELKPMVKDGRHIAPVIFTRRWMAYNAGELAWFPIAKATKLIKQGYARKPAPESKPAAKPSVASGEYVKKGAADKPKAAPKRKPSKRKTAKK